MNLTPDQRRERIEKIVKWGSIGTICLLVSPIIFLVVKGMLGVLIAFAVGSTAVAFAPWWSMKLANWRIKAIKAEATENPIPTLQNQLVQRQRAQKHAKDQLDQSNTALTQFSMKAEKLSKTQPQEAAAFAKQVALMQRAQETKVVKWQEVNQQLALFAAEIEKASAVWDVTQSMIEAKRAMGLVIDIDPLERIKTETALDAVQMSLASAVSDLEMSLAVDVPAARLEDKREAGSTRIIPATAELISRRQK